MEAVTVLLMPGVWLSPTSVHNPHPRHDKPIQCRREGGAIEHNEDAGEHASRYRFARQKLLIALLQPFDFFAHQGSTRVPHPYFFGTFDSNRE